MTNTSAATAQSATQPGDHVRYRIGTGPRATNGIVFAVTSDVRFSDDANALPYVFLHQATDLDRTGRRYFAWLHELVSERV